MKAHKNAEKLLDWLIQNQPATVAQMSALGVMSAKEVTFAVQYALRKGVFEPIKLKHVKPSERVRYRVTGRPLPEIKATADAPSFDGLLSAWGIGRPPAIGTQ